MTMMMVMMVYVSKPVRMYGELTGIRRSVYRGEMSSVIKNMAFDTILLIFSLLLYLKFVSFLVLQTRKAFLN